MTIQDLRKKYTEKTGKRPFAGWKEDKLQELIDAASEAVEEKVDNDVMEKARIENEMLLTDYSDPAPVHRDGEVFFIIENKYVPYWEGKVHFLKRDIKRIEGEIKDIERIYL